MKEKIKQAWNNFNDFLNDVPEHYENAMNGWLGRLIHNSIETFHFIRTNIPEIMVWIILGYIASYIFIPIIWILIKLLEGWLGINLGMEWLYNCWVTNNANLPVAYHIAKDTAQFWYKLGYLLSLFLMLNFTSGLLYGTIKRFIAIGLYGFIIYTWFDPKLFYDVEQMLIFFFILIPFIAAVLTKGKCGGISTGGTVPQMQTGTTQPMNTTPQVPDGTAKIISAYQYGDIVKVNTQRYFNGNGTSSSWSTAGTLVSFSENMVIVKYRDLQYTFNALGQKTSSKAYR